MARRMREMEFKSCPADPDTWLRPAVKPCGYQYFEYVTTWVDDGMAISDDPDKIIKALEKKVLRCSGSEGTL